MCLRILTALGCRSACTAHASGAHCRACVEAKAHRYWHRRAALASTQVLEPRIPVISNVDAQPHSDPDTIKDILARQVQSPWNSVRASSLPHWSICQPICILTLQLCAARAAMQMAVGRGVSRQHLLRAQGLGLNCNLRRGCARAADVAGAVGGDAGRAAGARPGAQLRAGPQQGHRRHHEAHRQGAPHHQHLCVSAGGLGAPAMERFGERKHVGVLLLL